jgi:hypothetical protein
MQRKLITVFDYDKQKINKSFQKQKRFLNIVTKILECKIEMKKDIRETHLIFNVPSLQNFNGRSAIVLMG